MLENCCIVFDKSLDFLLQIEKKIQTVSFPGFLIFFHCKSVEKISQVSLSVKATISIFSYEFKYSYRLF